MKAYKGDFPKTALVETFIKSLNCRSMEAHVGLQAPTALADAIRHACAFVAYSGEVMEGNRKPKQVNVAKSGGPITPDYGAQMQLLANRLDQLCLQLEKPRGGPTATSECFSCHGKGHFASSCPLKNQVPPPAPGPGEPYSHPNRQPQRAQLSYEQYRQAVNAAATLPQSGAVNLQGYPEECNSLNF